MKIVLVKFENPTEGDLLIVEYADVHRGGCHSAKHTVGHGETAAEIAAKFVHAISTDWMKEAFTAEVRGDKLKIGCTDLVSDRIVFRSHVAGNGATTVEIEEF